MSVVVEQSATSTGTMTHNTGWAAGDITSGGMPMIPVPDINADDYFNDADYVLQDDGRITNRTETIIYCNSASSTQAGYQTGCRDFTPPGGTAPFGWRLPQRLEYLGPESRGRRRRQPGDLLRRDRRERDRQPRDAGRPSAHHHHRAG